MQLHRRPADAGGNPGCGTRLAERQPVVLRPGGAGQHAVRSVPEMGYAGLADAPGVFWYALRAALTGAGASLASELFDTDYAHTSSAAARRTGSARRALESRSARAFPVRALRASTPGRR